MKLNIQAMRKRAGITQKQLADAIDVNLSTIGNWERSITCPDGEQIWACAVALHCTPNDILGWEDEAATTLTIEERAIVDCYRECTPQWQQNIVMTARAASGESKKKAQCDPPATVERQAIA